MRSSCNELVPIIGTPARQWPFYREEIAVRASIFRYRELSGERRLRRAARHGAVSCQHHCSRCVGGNYFCCCPQKVAALLPDASCQRAKAAFSRRGCIPGVLACVDGTLVAIEKPQGLSLGDTESYMTRKGYYALNVMVVSTLFEYFPPNCTFGC